MTKLENLRWTNFLAFTCYGARIGVRTNQASVLSQLQNALPPHSKISHNTKTDWLYSFWIAPPTRSGRKPFHVLYSNDEQSARLRDIDSLVMTFEREVQLAVAQKARRKVFVHAGVVGWQGRAILIPAKSYSGKSTLVHALVRAGATYYSDEFAVLDEYGRVHPFARHLALRDATRANRKISFDELGGTIGKRPLPIGTILVTKFRERAKWRPQTLSPGLGALELLGNCVVARSGNPFVLEVLTRVAKNARILKSPRGEAEMIAPQLLQQLT